MKLVSLFLLAGVLVSAAPITVATTAQIKLVNAGSPLADDGKYYVGPYTISINGQNVAAMCVDVLDEIKIGDTWTAALTNVGGDLSSTYHSDYAVQYEEEAYLYSLITQPGADRVDIQHAAWFITDSAYVIDAAAQTYVTQAQNNYAGMNFSGYELVSSTNSPHEQEFMVSSAPEPGAVMLLGAGLLVVGVVGRKKLVKS